MSTTATRIERAPFGSTGHSSSRVVFGAAALARMSQERADRLLELLLERGVNHIDTAAMYGDSELRVAPWMKRHRDGFFLATKTRERTREKAREEIHRSLERLGVDRVDLIQLHHLVDPEQWETALGDGGALEAAVEARDQGLVRFLGVTGHGTRAAERHLQSLERFPFDSVLFPYHWAALRDPQTAADVEALIAACTRRGVAMQTIKSIALRRWKETPERRFSWYEPLRDPEAIGAAVRWVLARPRLFLNSSSDASLLPSILDAATGGEPAPSDDELAALLEAQGAEPLFVRGVVEEV